MLLTQTINNMMKKLLLICLPFATTLALAQKTDEAVKYAGLITKEAMKEKLMIVASPEMEGRETGSAGERKAAAYIIEQFKRIGLKPGNGNSYQQFFSVYQEVLKEKKISVNGRSFEWDKDFSFTMQAISTGNWKYNNVVFAGNGIVDAEKKINDYNGLNVKDKIVLVLDDGGSSSRGNFGGPPLAKVNAARNLGAAGILFVSQNFPRRNPTTFKGRMLLAPATATASSFVTASISEEIASALLGRTSKIASADFKDINKGNYIAELNIVATKTTETLESSNIMGILPGTDKKDEYVFLTAHYDHLGKNGDQIWYGADDDGSGTVGVIQMAEAFMAAAKSGKKPRRNIVFMTVSGEEKGLIGSEYYSEHPVIPMDKVSADLNTDMIGRSDTERKTADSTNYIYVIGHDKLSSELVGINEGVNNKYTNLILDYKFDDPKDPTRIYYRSDHYNFARKGVPILFFYDGMLQGDYHKITDTIDKINFDLMEKRARLIFYTGWEIINRDNMLKRDIPLSMPPR
jgi:hypothetical protein